VRSLCYKNLAYWETHWEIKGRYRPMPRSHLHWYPLLVRALIRSQRTHARYPHRWALRSPPPAQIADFGEYGRHPGSAATTQKVKFSRENICHPTSDTCSRFSVENTPLFPRVVCKEAHSRGGSQPNPPPGPAVGSGRNSNY
jgi:hypothetical protein